MKNKSHFYYFHIFSESDKLQIDLQKVHQLESKITSELDVLNNRITTMENELVVYSNLDGLKSDGEAKKKV